MKYNWKKNTALFLSSQAISIFGSSLVQFAITTYITIQTKSGLYATLSIVCAILPTFLLSPFAGVWADKYNRKTLIMIADGGIAVCTLLVSIAFLLGHGALWLLFVALAVRALGAAIQSPCVGAMLPDIVPEENLTRINGINGSLQSLFTLASPMLGALLLSVAPLEVVFLIDVATAAIAIIIMAVAFVLPEKEKKPQSDGNYFTAIKQGIGYIRRKQYLIQFFSFCVFFFFMAAPSAFLTQVQVVRNFGDEYWRLSTVEVAFSVGMLIGGITIATWGGFKNRVHTIILSTFMMGVCAILLGIQLPFVPYIAVMALFGMAMPLLNTSAMVLLQERVNPQYMGRVFGFMTMLNTSIMPLAMIVFGPIADIIQIEWLLLGSGAIILLLTLLMARAKALLLAGIKAVPGEQEIIKEV